MNQDQVMGILRVVVPMVIAYCVAKGWVSTSQAADVGAAVITIGAAVWSGVAHTDSAKIAAVAAMPDVAKVEIKSTAAVGSPGQTAAVDTAQPKVVSVVVPPAAPKV